jgi:hypothetical protein
MKKRARVPESREKLVVFAWPCGCVTSKSRDGQLLEDCGDERCYRRTRPATVRVVQ